MASRLRVDWFICLTLWVGIFVTAQAQTPKTYWQKTRTFHTAEEFARITKGKVKIQRSPKYKLAEGGFLVGQKGVVPRLGTLPIYADVTVIAKSRGYWIGTMQGLIFKTVNVNSLILSLF